MEAILDEIEKEAIAYFKKEEDDKREKARSDKIWLMRSYYALKDRVTYANAAKDKERARAARKALKAFRLEHNLTA